MTGALVAPVLFEVWLERFFQLEACYRLAAHLDTFAEHLQRSDPQPILTVQRTVNHQRLFALAMPGGAEYLVETALVVTVNAGGGMREGHVVKAPIQGAGLLSEGDCSACSACLARRARTLAAAKK